MPTTFTVYIVFLQPWQTNNFRRPNNNKKIPQTDKQTPIPPNSGNRLMRIISRPVGWTMHIDHLKKYYARARMLQGCGRELLSVFRAKRNVARALLLDHIPRTAKKVNADMPFLIFIKIKAEIGYYVFRFPQTIIYYIMQSLL